VQLEFGKALVAKTAAVVALVEDVIPELGDDSVDHVTAIIHAGADLFVRTVYGGTKYCNHRIIMLESDGSIKPPAGLVSTTVAGPLCFSGDNLASRILLPSSQPGDRCMLMDAGANTISMFRLIRLLGVTGSGVNCFMCSRHCSRTAPPVYGFRSVGSEQACRGGDDEASNMMVVCVKEAEFDDDALKFWD
jgi:hypothetical protein